MTSQTNKNPQIAVDRKLIVKCTCKLTLAVVCLLYCMKCCVRYIIRVRAIWFRETFGYLSSSHHKQSGATHGEQSEPNFFRDISKEQREIFSQHVDSDRISFPIIDMIIIWYVAKTKANRGRDREMTMLDLIIVCIFFTALQSKMRIRWWQKWNSVSIAFLESIFGALSSHRKMKKAPAISVSNFYMILEVILKAVWVPLSFHETLAIRGF